MKSKEYYQRKFFEKMTTLWGFMVIISTAFCGGVVVGKYIERHLCVLEDIKCEREFSIELLDCENNRIKEVNTIKENFQKEVEELKKKVYEYEQRKY